MERMGEREMARRGGEGKREGRGKGGGEISETATPHQPPTVKVLLEPIHPLPHPTPNPQLVPRFSQSSVDHASPPRGRGQRGFHGQWHPASISRQLESCSHYDAQENA